MSIQPGSDGGAIRGDGRDFSGHHGSEHGGLTAGGLGIWDMGYPSGGGSKGGPGSAPGGEYGTTANHNKSDTMVKTALNTDVDVRSAMDQLLGGDGKVFRGDNHQSDDRQAKKNNRDAVMAAALFTEAGRDSSNPQGDVIKNQLADMFAKSDGNTTVAHWQGQVMDNIRRV